MMRYSILYILMLGLIACGTGDTIPQSEVKAETVPEVTLKGHVELDLSEFGDYDYMMVPGRSRSGVDPKALLDELNGYVTITAGKGFRMILREEPTTLKDIGQELSQDLMWTNELIPQNEHSVLIHRSLPDGSLSTYHFAAVIPAAGMNIVLRSDPMIEFNQKQAERMLQSAMTLTTGAGIALLP